MPSKINTITIVIPAFRSTGPIRGAVAIANGLSDHYRVEIVALKGCLVRKELLGLRDSVTLTDFRMHKWPRKYSLLKQRMVPGTALLSLCFAADFIVSLLPGRVPKLTSVRGNLEENYIHDYGPFKGKILSFIHYRLLSRFSLVLAMSDFMLAHLKELGIPRLQTIYNFVDEGFLEKERMRNPRKDVTFFFLGNLNTRKKPELLLRVFERLRRRNPEIRLSYFGDGPLMTRLRSLTAKHALQNAVSIPGHVDHPYQEIQRAKINVLPSLSEGVSRSILESLHFGIPCVLREGEAASELIVDQVNGALFKTDEELEGVLEKVLENYEAMTAGKASLIPEKFRMEFNITKLRKLLESLEVAP